MAKDHEAISPRLKRFIEEQHIFFVATAPLDAKGTVNLSPKGLDSLRVLGPRSLAYLDLTGSGSETSAHIRENGRITVMLCSFTHTPSILRLSGHADVYKPESAGWLRLRPLFKDIPGERQIIEIDIRRIRSSCGFGVPVMEFIEERELMEDWALKKGQEGLERYREVHNRCSVDGLPT